MMYTFLNLLFSMFFILEHFCFPFLTTYMELFWITDCEIYVFSITKDSHFQSMENKTFPYPCYILFKVLKVNALNTKSHTRYQFLLFSYKPCIVVLLEFGRIIWIHIRKKIQFLYSQWSPFNFFKGCLTFQAAHKNQTLWVPKLKLLPHLLQLSQVRQFEIKMSKQEWMTFHYSCRTFIYLRRCL